MQLKKLKINNFHGIEEMELDLYDFTSLIGPNNCGKSTILRAIEIFLEQKKPNVDEWKKGNESEPIIIEGCFEHITEEERKTPGIAGIVNDGVIKLRVTIVNSDGKIEVSHEAFIKQYEITGWTEKWSELSETIKEVACSLQIDNGAKWRGKANKELVREKILMECAEITELVGEDWTSENISIAPALKQALPKVIIIPAVKNALDIMKSANTTVFGKLLNRIILPAVQEIDEYKELEEVIEKLSKRLAGESESGEIEAIKDLREDVSKRLSSIVDTTIKISMTPPNTDKFLGSNTTITMNDGTETSIDLQGHGAQRALIFALIEVLAKKESKDSIQRTSILLFEEPELYLHPHLMTRLKKALKEISRSDFWQVVISTHSPFLIDVVDNPRSLVILNRLNNTEAPLKKQLKEDPFNNKETREDEIDALRASLNFHPTVNECFFAKRVVLVEGDTELALFNHEAQIHSTLGISDADYNNTTVVSCGGKWTIVPYAKLLSAFGIPFRIIHDCDRKERTEEDLKLAISIDPYRANEKIKSAANGNKIFVVDDTLEHLIWGKDKKVASKNKPYLTWKKIKEISIEKDGFEKYEDLKELVRFAYDWS